MMSQEPAEPDFRREYAKLVATLSRRFGVEQLAAIEDAAQLALVRALERWPLEGQPERPSAWLLRVAHNALLDELRTQGNRRRLLARGREQLAPSPEPQLAAPLPSELRDDLLRMLFVCCDDQLPAASQLVLALSALCGFSVAEIAQRLMLSEANVYKRRARARERLRERPGGFAQLERLTPEALCTRLPSVHRVLHQLFTEGYLSSHPELAIREELCAEALRLTLLLVEHPAGDTPQTAALLALMYLHGARLRARSDPAGALLLLEQQDRGQWDRAKIGVGLEWLARSARGDRFSRYHAEAAIAAEHCLAPDLERTRWDVIAELYAQLEQLEPSPLHRLARALALAEAEGPAAGLALLEGFEPPTWLAGSYTWPAVLADLHRRCGHEEQARRQRELALKLAPSPALRALLERRLAPLS